MLSVAHAIPSGFRRGLATAVKVSPAARILASRHGLDWTTVTGTGPKGIILKGDVLVAAGLVSPLSGTPAAQTSAVPIDNSYPAHSPLGMPALSPTMTAGNVGKWRVKVGDQVSAGDVLCEIETDKATVDFENQEDGYIATILVPEGTPDVSVGKVLAVLVEDEEDIAAFANYAEPAAPKVAFQPTPATTASNSTPPAPNAETQAAAAPASAAVASGEEAPVYYLTVECVVDRAQSFCDSTGIDDLTWTSMALRSSCAAIQQVPAANSVWLGPEITRQYHQVHIECIHKDGTHSLIRSADSLGVQSLNTELVKQTEVSFAPTFCVSFSGDVSFARQRVGVGQSVMLTLSEPAVKAVPSDCKTGVRDALVVTATLTCDHRTVDGALGAEWLKHFKTKLEDPLMLLL